MFAPTATGADGTLTGWPLTLLPGSAEGALEGGFTEVKLDVDSCDRDPEVVVAAAVVEVAVVTAEEATEVVAVLGNEGCDDVGGCDDVMGAGCVDVMGVGCVDVMGRVLFTSCFVELRITAGGRVCFVKPLASASLFISAAFILKFFADCVCVCVCLNFNNEYMCHSTLTVHSLTKHTLTYTQKHTLTHHSVSVLLLTALSALFGASFSGDTSGALQLGQVNSFSHRYS